MRRRSHEGGGITISPDSPALNPYHTTANPDCAIVVFAKLPVAGQAKTRLAPILGSRGAAELQAALITDTLRKVAPLARCASLFLLTAGCSPGGARSIAYGRTADVALFRQETQRGKDLGERLARAFRSLHSNYQRVVIVGTDSPALSAPILRRALRALMRADAVLGPCSDGGYYLVGLRRGNENRLPRTLFHGVRWGTSSAFEDTWWNFNRAGLASRLLEILDDVDTPEDLERLRSQFKASAGMRRRAPAAWKFLSATSALGPRNALQALRRPQPVRSR